MNQVVTIVVGAGGPDIVRALRERDEFKTLVARLRDENARLQSEGYERVQPSLAEALERFERTLGPMTERGNTIHGYTHVACDRLDTVLRAVASMFHRIESLRQLSKMRYDLVKDDPPTTLTREQYAQLLDCQICIVRDSLKAVLSHYGMKPDPRDSGTPVSIEYPSEFDILLEAWDEIRDSHMAMVEDESSPQIQAVYSGIAGAFEFCSDEMRQVLGMPQKYQLDDLEGDDDDSDDDEC